LASRLISAVESGHRDNLDSFTPQIQNLIVKKALLILLAVAGCGLVQAGEPDHKVIQFQVVPSNQGKHLFVLCEDGSLWEALYIGNVPGKWNQVIAPPN
jgi:hypothetical protein